MTVPFYSQEELDAALAKERQWIVAEIVDRADRCERTPHMDPANASKAVLLYWFAARIAERAFARPLVIAPRVQEADDDG